MTGRTTPSPVLVASALSAAALIAVTGVVVRDFEAIAIGAGIGLATALLWFRKGSVGRVLLVLFFADTIAWLGPAAWSNLQGSSGTSGLPFRSCSWCSPPPVSRAWWACRTARSRSPAWSCSPRSVLAAVVPVGDDGAPSVPGALVVNCGRARSSRTPRSRLTPATSPWCSRTTTCSGTPSRSTRSTSTFGRR